MPLIEAAIWGYALQEKMPITICRLTMIPVEDMPLEKPRYGANAEFHYKKNALHYTQRKNKRILRYAHYRNNNMEQENALYYTQRKNETFRGMPLIESAICVKCLLALHEKCPSLYPA